MDVLDERQCWELLAAHQVGRLATVVGGHPDIYPVNYLVHDGDLYFKTAEGSKLAAVIAHSEVAFEIDGWEPDSNEAWSVVVHGVARALSHDAEIDTADELPLFPWNLEPKRRYVVIEPTGVSGRRFVAEGRQQ